VSLGKKQYTYIEEAHIQSEKKKREIKEEYRIMIGIQLN